MGDWLAIADFLISRADNIASACIIVALIAAAWIAVAEHKEKLWYYITHRRNKWFFVLLVIYAASIILLAQSECLPVSMTCVMFLLWAVYCVACLLSLKPKTDYTNLILKHYKKQLNEGLAAENHSYFQKATYWYFWDTDDRIQYQKLRAAYLSATGDYEGAYHALCSIKESDLYEEEKEQINLNKAILLVKMGNMTAAQELLGPENENTSQNPTVWFSYGFIHEQAGDMDRAFACAQKAKGLAQTSDIAQWEKAVIYNDYGRYPLFRGNNQEALYYFQQAYENAKDSKNIHTYHVVTSNLIMRMAVLGYPRTECEALLNAYRERIKKQSIENMVEFQNCQITYYRQIADDVKVYELIRTGYWKIGTQLPHRQKVMFKASTFRMLMNGHFVHDWFDSEVKSEMEEYLPLELMERLHVFKEYMGILEQIEFSWLRWQEPYKTLRENIMDYYKTRALDEINACLAELDSANVYRYKALVMHKLGILKLIQGKSFVEKSKQQYLDLYKTLMDAGLQIEAADVLMTLIDECASKYNVMLRLAPWEAPVYYCDFIERAGMPPKPRTLPDGIHEDVSKLMHPPCEVIPLQEATVREHIDQVIALCDTWQNHPARLNMSIHVAHILMCLGRREEAERFYRFFKCSNLSALQFSSWVVGEMAALEREFDSK